ncbi:hypothetical protein Tco_1117870, partial [Tanacetum coccineum]
INQINLIRQQLMAFIHLKLKKDVVLVKGFNKVESWTFQISFAELLLSCSSAEPLDEGTYIIRLLLIPRLDRFFT